jgi:hypothetical protein
MPAIHLIDLIDPLMLWLPDATWSDASQHLLGQLSGQLSLDLHRSLDWMQPCLAQQFETDVFRGARVAFNNFVRSGQAWALLAGFVIGYIVRGLTTYG